MLGHQVGNGLNQFLSYDLVSRSVIAVRDSNTEISMSVKHSGVAAHQEIPQSLGYH